jgi:5'-3' exonuclease
VRRAIIDGDILVYSAGFAGRITEYKVEDEKGGFDIFFRYKKDAVKFCKDKGIDPETITKVQKEEPLEFVLANAKRIINKICLATECDDYVIYISGSNNFRKEEYPDYKANRDPTHKPLYYADIQDYLIEHHAAKVTDTIEADDAMAMDADPEKDVICTLDKDLDTICGWRYNWRKDEMYYVEWDDADRFFWMQMLMGDPADNVVGIPGIGPKTAEKILSKGEEEGSLRRCIVGHEYAKHFDDPEEMYTKNARLLFIMR